MQVTEKECDPLLPPVRGDAFYRKTMFKLYGWSVLYIGLMKGLKGISYQDP